MCGIAGFVALSGPPGDADVLRRMAGALGHRGPDGEGVRLEADGRVGLAHRRLAVIDLSETGAQPMSDAGGDRVIVYNGEIFNFGEIRRELEARGDRFLGTSDTEVILAAYRAWGAACVRRFVGMFAFAIWDRTSKTLLLARDRLGIKPLYLHEAPGLFLFASELKAFPHHPAFSADVDPRALRDYLRFGYVPAPRAILRNCRKLLPGRTATLALDGTWTEETYWDPRPLYLREPPPRPDAESEDALAGLLRASVRSRMVSDVPLGAFLSGGVDSSLVVALMQSLAPRPVRTFTVRFREAGYDEGPDALRVARHLGTEHHETFCGRDDGLRMLRRLPSFFDEPFADSSALPMAIVSGFCRGGVTVALSGDGGDELFGGYNRYRWIAAAERFRPLPRGARRALSAVLGRLPARQARRAAAVLRYDAPADVYFPMVGLFEDRHLAAVLPAEAGNGADDARDLPFHDAFRDGGRLPPARRAMLCDLVSYLPDDILAKVDRTSMAFGLEARVPLLDHRIVEFAAGLPADVSSREAARKRILKRILGRYVPPALFERPKHGFSVPIEEWLSKGWEGIVREYLGPERIRREGFFDAEGVTRLVREPAGGRKSHFHRIWALVMFGMWRETFLPNAFGEARRSIPGSRTSPAPR